MLMDTIVTAGITYEYNINLIALVCENDNKMLQ